MIEVFCEFRIEAAHFLPNVPEGHKCRRVHGHSYRVIVGVAGQPKGSTGWIVDYAEIEGIWTRQVHDKIDHQVLNEVLGFGNTTSENLAEWIARQLITPINELGGARLLAVEVWETARFGARWVAIG